MNVLLLHSGDQIPFSSKTHWELIVDLARAPIRTYEDWGRQNGCPVKSLFDFAEGMQDLHRIRELVQPGMGILLDDLGIDWWGVLSPSFVAQIQQLLLIQRLAKTIHRGCNLYATRSDWRARALQYFLGCDLHVNTRASRASGKFPIGVAKRYFDAATNLDGRQLQQVLWDKFDSCHSIRRRIASLRKCSGSFVVLPSAYINVSRMAVSYSTLLPDEQFLLVCARGSAQLKHLPSNVAQISLDPYFAAVSRRAFEPLLPAVNALKKQLASSSGEFKAAISLGVLDHVPSLLRWGINMRDAWEHLFRSIDVTACFSTDDSNPYTRIPLLLAQKRQVPTLACHHGALDSMMAVKTRSADIYLAKGEMEYDYLSRVCRVPAKHLTIAEPPKVAIRAPAKLINDKERWLVFFSEPFNAMHWRGEEVYRDLLPKLLRAAEQCRLKMVFKLHPFESIKALRRLLKRISPEAARISMIFAGPSTSELWERTSCAIVIQSTAAIECAERGIPVFMCSWLRDPYSEYVQQFERFGVGKLLKDAAEIEEIPDMLTHPQNNRAKADNACSTDPLAFRAWLRGDSLEKAARA
jgi:hypothetical protein